MQRELAPCPNNVAVGGPGGRLEQLAQVGHCLLRLPVMNQEIGQAADDGHGLGTLLEGRVELGRRLVQVADGLVTLRQGQVGDFRSQPLSGLVDHRRRFFLVLRDHEEAHQGHPGFKRLLRPRQPGRLAQRGFRFLAVFFARKPQQPAQPQVITPVPRSLRCPPCFRQGSVVVALLAVQVCLKALIFWSQTFLCLHLLEQLLGVREALLVPQELERAPHGKRVAIAEAQGLLIIVERMRHIAFDLFKAGQRPIRRSPGRPAIGSLLKELAGFVESAGLIPLALSNEGAGLHVTPGRAFGVNLLDRLAQGLEVVVCSLLQGDLKECQADLQILGLVHGNLAP